MYGALRAPFAFLHGYLAPFLKATSVTRLLCILELFYADKKKKINEDIKYFNNAINRLDLMDIRRILYQQLQHTHFTPFKDPRNIYTNWSMLGHEANLNKFQTTVIETIFSDHITIMLEFNNKDKSLYIWNLRNTVLNNLWTKRYHNKSGNMQN